MISEAEINVIDRLLESLGNWATILYIRGDLNGAMAVYKEQERICRELSPLSPAILVRSIQWQ